MCKYIYICVCVCVCVCDLPPYQISHTCSRSSFTIIKGYLSKHIQCRHLAVSHYITIYITIYILHKFYISPRYSSTQNMFCRTYPSHLKSPHVVLFFITECLQLKPKSSWCPPPQGHHNVHTVICNNRSHCSDV